MTEETNEKYLEKLAQLEEAAGGAFSAPAPKKGKAKPSTSKPAE